MKETWTLSYQGYQPAQEGLREALCTVGNGYFCTRGAFAQAHDDNTHYPGTYLAGGYNRLSTVIKDKLIENEDLVNMPNWLPLTFRTPGEREWFYPSEQSLEDYSLELDLFHGVLNRRFVAVDGKGRRTKVHERRFISMQKKHLAGIELRITPENWSGRMRFKTSLDGTVINNGVPRYRKLASKHLEPLDTGRFQDDIILLHVRTNQSRIEVAQGARTRVYDNGELRDVARDFCSDRGFVCQNFSIDVQEGREMRVEKMVSFFSSRDSAISEPLHQARKSVYRAGNFAEEFALHDNAWSRLWRRFGIEFDLADKSGDGETEMILRLYTFHLLQTSSVHNMDLDVGVPARGWHGEAYRGHIFWDELYIFPTINYRIPEITRGLLMYRYRRLDEARAIAESEGLRGAIYPWQSGSDGREESQVLHLNPKSGEWVPDNTRLQRHVNAAIAYNIYQYYYVTGDKEFLDFYGMEMMLEIAKFWGDIAEYDEAADRYEIKGVMGPDEFHDAYPWSDEPGLDNNAYTNVMAAWVLSVTLELFSHLTNARMKDLTRQLRVTQDDLDYWQHVSKRLKIPFHDGHIISQFEGYEKLDEFDWEGYREKYGDIHRLDRLLGAEGDTVNKYKASKQADVLMLFYLFDTEDLIALFNRMGYDFDPEWISDNIEYYLHRTSHGSTLSNVVHSWIISRSNRCLSWELFKTALQSDVADIQGGTTPEGIHVGAMAGTVDIIQRGYTDINPRGDVLWFNPSIPVELDRMCMRIRFRGQSLSVRITTTELEIQAGTALAKPVKVGYEGEIHELSPGETVKMELKESAVCTFEPETAG